MEDCPHQPSDHTTTSSSSSSTSSTATTPMAWVRTFALPHYEAFAVHVALFKDVRNARFLKSQLLQANPDFDYAFLDADLILSPNHLLASAFITLHALQTHRHKTRAPHAELVFRLSPTNNIAESFNKFGLSDSTTNLIAVKLPLISQSDEWVVDETVTNQSVSQHLTRIVEGTSVEIGEEGLELGQACHLEKVRKVYKLGAESAPKRAQKGAAANGGDEWDHRKDMETVILGTMTLKGT
ncbi:hypothetical protein BDU57DRAFT_516745 [Ampelomyces quisqualis]|uniref:EKC/KEOPS complex subunit CGI121 n=1 Tax=Ampelomyces quisqualis TaxID=50730 RepID=A0A6A5QMA6_AMPQU|nr:hypothetical protein BDU57DRAFT_516745 [Ampelomyces quisqualis]